MKNGDVVEVPIMPKYPGLHKHPKGTFCPAECRGHETAAQRPAKFGNVCVATMEPLKPAAEPGVRALWKWRLGCLNNKGVKWYGLSVTMEPRKPLHKIWFI